MPCPPSTTSEESAGARQVRQNLLAYRSACFAVRYADLLFWLMAVFWWERRTVWETSSFHD